MTLDRVTYQHLCGSTFDLMFLLLLLYQTFFSSMFEMFFHLRGDTTKDGCEFM